MNEMQNTQQSIQDIQASTPPALAPDHQLGDAPAGASQGEFQQEPVVSWGAVAVSTAEVLAADLGYTMVKGLVFAMDFWAALEGLLDWDEVRWDPTEEDVRGKHPGLDAFRDRAYARFYEAMGPVHRRRVLRQQALSHSRITAAEQAGPDEQLEQPLDIGK